MELTRWTLQPQCTWCFWLVLKGQGTKPLPGSCYYHPAVSMAMMYVKYSICGVIIHMFLYRPQFHGCTFIIAIDCSYHMVAVMGCWQWCNTLHYAYFAYFERWRSGGDCGGWRWWCQAREEWGALRGWRMNEVYMNIGIFHLCGSLWFMFMLFYLPFRFIYSS